MKMDELRQLRRAKASMRAAYEKQRSIGRHFGHVFHSAEEWIQMGRAVRMLDGFQLLGMDPIFTVDQLLEDWLDAVEQLEREPDFGLALGQDFELSAVLHPEELPGFEGVALDAALRSTFMWKTDRSPGCAHADFRAGTWSLFHFQGMWSRSRMHRPGRESFKLRGDGLVVLSGAIPMPPSPGCEWLNLRAIALPPVSMLLAFEAEEEAPADEVAEEDMLGRDSVMIGDRLFVREEDETASAFAARVNAAAEQTRSDDGDEDF